MKKFVLLLILSIFTCTINVYSQSSNWKYLENDGDELTGVSKSSVYVYKQSNYTVQIRVTASDAGVECFINDGIIDWSYIPNTTTKMCSSFIGLYDSNNKLIKKVGFPKNILIVDKTDKCAYSYRNSLFKLIYAHLTIQGNYIRIVIPRYAMSNIDIVIPSLI